MRWIIAKGYPDGSFAHSCKSALPSGAAPVRPRRAGSAGAERRDLNADSRPPFLSQLPQQALPWESGAAPARPTGRKEGREVRERRDGGEVSRGVPGTGEDSHESADRARRDFTASREEAPGAEGRRSGRSERRAGRGTGLGAGQAVRGRAAPGGSGRAGSARGRGADLSPLLLLLPLGLLFPPRPETWRAFRLQVALQRRTAGVGVESSGPRGEPRGAGRGEGCRGCHDPTVPRARRSHPSGGRVRKADQQR